METKITLSGMSFYAHHGCYETEQRVGTHFRVDLIVTYDSKQAALDDNIDKAVNYLNLYQTVRREMMISSHLLENIAHRILQSIGREFTDVKNAEVSVTKIAPPLGGDINEVTATISRSY